MLSKYHLESVSGYGSSPVTRRRQKPEGARVGMRELGIRIGGAAGQGLQRAGLLLGKTFVRSGYHVFATQDAMSRIRGGHNFFQLQIREEPHAAMSRGVGIAELTCRFAGVSLRHSTS